MFAVTLIIQIHMVDSRSQHTQCSLQCTCIRYIELHDLSFSSAICINNKRNWIFQSHDDIGVACKRMGITIQIRFITHMHSQLFELTCIKQIIPSIDRDRKICLLRNNIQKLRSLLFGQFLQLIRFDIRCNIKRAAHTLICKLRALSHLDEVIIGNR